MNIMLASILERTREIGVRRAVGARQSDIIRQFVVEATLISFVGGSFGIVFGFAMSRLIALLAGWSTIVTFSSIALAFLVSISVGLIFGIYPATKAARLDPVEAIRLRATRLKVIRRGKIIAETPMQQPALALLGRPGEVSFSWPPPQS